MATDTLTATQRETLGVFDAAGAPLSTTEVASALDRGRRSTYERLDRLAEAGALETKKVGASARVWWRPRARRRETGAEPASLVSALEEYAIVGLDPEGRIRTWTPGAEAVTGYAAEQARGEHVSRLYTDADTAAGVPGAHLERARETGSVAEEGWRVRADGSRFRASVTITPMREEAGELTGYASVMRDVTERRAREEALRTERTQLERVLETGQVGVGVFDGDGEAIRTNRRFRDLLGRPAEAGDLELGEATVRELDGDPLPPAERPAQLAIATGEPVEDRHVSVETADGGRRILSVDAAPLADGGDSVVVTASDVTALVEQARRLEQRHEDLLAEFEEMFDRIDDAFFALDADWRFTYVNERAGEVLDRAPGRLVGENVWEAFPAAADSTFRDRYREAVQTSESVTFEEYFPPLGAWFAVSAYPSESGLSVYFRDVTERKRREAERERYAGLVDAVGEPVYELDEAGRFVFVNDAFLEYSGYGEEELLGEHVSVGMREADIDRVEGRILEHLAGDAEGPLTVEYEVESKGGERIPVENRISVLRDDDGSIRGTAGVMWDVSDRRERERELTERIRQQEAVTDLSTRALAVEDVDALLEEAVRTVADTLGVEYASALDLDAAGGELCLRAGVGWDAGVVGEATVPAVDADSQAARALTAASPVVVEDLAAESRFATPALLGDHGVTSGVTAVVGPPADPWGVLGVYESAAAEFSARDVTFLQSVANVLATAIERHRDERALQRSREQLAALNSLNALAREVTDAVIDQSTRERIEATVCEELAASDSYSVAWVGDVDPGSGTVSCRAEAGLADATAEPTATVDPDAPAGENPTGRAVRTGEVQVAHDGATPGEQAGGRGLGSRAAVPVAHEGTVYGTLTVAAERPDAFEDAERTVLAQLGEVVGHAIAASERKQALMSDDVLDLEFHVRDVLGDLGVDATVRGRVDFEHAVAVGDEAYLLQGRATDAGVETVRALVDGQAHWESVTVRGEAGDRRFRALLSRPPLLSTVASLGATVTESTLSPEGFDIRVEAAPSAEVRRIREAIRGVFPSAELRRRRQYERPSPLSPGSAAALTEDLTDRQRTVVETAYHAGFFEWPRAVDGEDLAGTLGISAPTFHQHLRKAEQAVFETVFERPRVAD